MDYYIALFMEGGFTLYKAILLCILGVLLAVVPAAIAADRAERSRR